MSQNSSIEKEILFVGRRTGILRRDVIARIRSPKQIYIPQKQIPLQLPTLVRLDFLWQRWPRVIGCKSSGQRDHRCIQGRCNPRDEEGVPEGVHFGSSCVHCACEIIVDCQGAG